MLESVIYDRTGQDSRVWCSFTSGGVGTLAVGDIVTGATSGATAKVARIDVASGTWAGGDAEGALYVQSVVGTFVAENLNQNGGQANIATIAAAPMATHVLFNAQGAITAAAPKVSPPFDMAERGFEEMLIDLYSLVADDATDNLIAELYGSHSDGTFPASLANAVPTWSREVAGTVTAIHVPWDVYSFPYAMGRLRLRSAGATSTWTATVHLIRRKREV